MVSQSDRQAVVLGASIAGLLCAQVLAESFDQVTIVDRDPLPDRADGASPTPRRGVPQGKHAHALLTGGLIAIEQLLPGTTEDLIKLGARHGDVLGVERFCVNRTWFRRTDIGHNGLNLSRPLLESYLRDRILARPQITVLDEHDVVGIEASPDRQRVTGARVQARSGGAEQVIPAGLVVDATGRGSRTPLWLTELGFDRPAEDRLEIDLAYGSRWYRLSPDDLDGDSAILVGPTLDCPRGGILQATEDGRAIVTVGGVLGDHPPTDPEGYLRYLAEMPVPAIYEQVRDAEPLSDPVRYKFPASVRHRYERLRRFPAGLLVIGDAISSINPLYGHGMSVAALEALTLRKALARGGEIDPLRYFRQVAPTVKLAWDAVNGTDVMYPGMPATPTRVDRWLHRYLDRLYIGAGRDVHLAVAFVKVINLIAPPWTLLRPDIMLRVLVRGGPSPTG